ncbi:MAG: adenylate kinase [Caldilineaceae bacterium]|jgi:adenylate kinase
MMFSDNKCVYVVMLGVPGAGKGTQARVIEEELGIPQISTGDLFRYNISNATDLGRLAKSYIDAGDLVPDEVTIGMVRQRLHEDDCTRGAIFDGFPRDLNQAVALDELIEPTGGVDVVPFIDLDDDEVMRRMTGRRVCPKCGRTYHVDYNPPKVEGTCDDDGAELYQREDDKPETVRNRLYVYYKQTAPIVGYYFAKGLLEEVDGAQPIEAVTADLHAVLRKRGLLWTVAE